MLFEIPEQNEKERYSKARKALWDIKKISNLGWRSQYSIKEGIKRTLEMLVMC